MEEIFSFLIVLIAGLFGGYQWFKRRQESNSPRQPSKSNFDVTEDIKEEREEASKKVTEEIANESKANVVKRFFDAFSHSPYTNDSGGNGDSKD